MNPSPDTMTEISSSPKMGNQTRNDHYYRTLYNTPPDFKELARKNPDFAKVVQGRDLDFNDPSAVIQLTKALLKHDFEIEIELPGDRLCPPVENRHNYILWLKDLLDTTSYEERSHRRGLDIGTGASCIYPLLGCTQRPWSFIATDIDDKNIEWAKKNVEANGLGSHIQLLRQNPKDSLIPLAKLDIKTLDFIMTNPPFYESEEQMLQKAALKSRAPFTACSGAKVEMITEGGEVGFFERILTESLLLRDRVQWYTTMFGFLSSVTKAIEMLLRNGVDNYAVTEFVQGTTRRWAIGWSFQSMRPSSSVARGIKTALSRSISPPVTEADILSLPLPESIGDFAENLHTAISTLELISWTWDTQKLEGVGRAADRVWSRAWRRQKKKNQQVPEGDKTSTALGEMAGMFGFKVAMRINREDILVTCRWLEGHDAVTFESFQGHLKRTVKEISSKKEQ